MTTDKYAGCMPDALFKTLTPAKEREFRQWARDNWAPVTPAKFSLYHPVIRHEWRIIDEGMFVTCVLPNGRNPQEEVE